MLPQKAAAYVDSRQWGSAQALGTEPNRPLKSLQLFPVLRILLQSYCNVSSLTWAHKQYGLQQGHLCVIQVELRQTLA